MSVWKNGIEIYGAIPYLAYHLALLCNIYSAVQT